MLKEIKLRPPVFTPAFTSHTERHPVHTPLIRLLRPAQTMHSYVDPACAGLPPFMYTSLMGFHIKDLDAFMKSGLADPISDDPDK